MTVSHAVEARAPSRRVDVLSGMEVVVVGVDATLTHRRAARTAMDDYAELISDCTPLRAVQLPMPDCDVRTVVSTILDLPWPVSAVFVVGLRHSESATVQRRVADRGGPLVITELDTITIALAAAAVGNLRVLGTASRQGRIVIDAVPSSVAPGRILTPPDPGFPTHSARRCPARPGSTAAHPRDHPISRQNTDPSPTPQVSAAPTHRRQLLN